MSLLRYLHLDPDQNTWADCLAESLKIAIDYIENQQDEDFPCSCDAGRTGADHDEECQASWREMDTEVLLGQLTELHRLASLSCAPSSANPEIWIRGPDSEAARACRGQGNVTWRMGGGEDPHR